MYQTFSSVVGSYTYITKIMYANNSKYLILLIVILIIPPVTRAQIGTVTIDECYQWAKNNYPTIKKLDLITKSNEYNISNVNKRFLPQLFFSGQATYQSDVIDFSDVMGSIPGSALPIISKNQYKIEADVNQLIYDGGSMKNQKELIKANTDLQQQNIESDLYSIKQRINDLYFSILLMDGQLKQNELNRANLQTQIEKTEVAIANGIAFRSNLDELKAEILTIKMISKEYQSNRTAYLKMLGLLTGKNLSLETKIEIPEMQHLTNDMNRPELKAFDLQKIVYDVKENQLKSDNLPQVSAFFQGAFGRPTLNIIENKFGPWYSTGLKMTWSLGNLYSFSNNQNLLKLNRQSIDADKQTFLLNTNLQIMQQKEQIKNYIELIVEDKEIITLREAVRRSAEAQLQNGVITIHEYIQKVNASHLAKQAKILHEIQLLQAYYNQKYISGN